jgi:hypothetical protein
VEGGRARLGNTLFLAAFRLNRSVKFLETLSYWLKAFTCPSFAFTIGKSLVSFTRLNKNIFCFQ